MSDFSGPLKTIVTRKDHNCDCFERYRDSGYCVDDVPTVHADAVKEASQANGVIPKGTECYTWSGKFDGEMYTAYAFKGMHDLICDMGWFDN